MTFQMVLNKSMRRPWALLFTEPIVLLLTIYLAIVYGILYMLFGAFPVVYQQHRQWTQGVAGLPFLGVAIGMVFSMLYNILDNRRYIQVVKANHGHAPPESRLPPSIVGSFALPVGLFWFAWTSGASVPWPASVAAGIPFGFGMVLVFMGIINYLVDAYTIYAASVMAANSVLRSLFGAAFPLFTVQMYNKLGTPPNSPTVASVADVTQHRHPLGFFACGVPSPCVSTVPLALLQVRICGASQMQVRGAGGEVCTGNEGKGLERRARRRC